MDTSTIIVALVGAASALTVGVLGHQRSKVVDANAAQSGIVANHRAGTAQVLDGLNDLIDQLQEDNTTFREDIKRLRDRLDIITAERDALRLEIARMRRKYGNGDDTPIPPTVSL